MTLGLLGRKKGMTQVFGKDGEVIPVTVIHAGPCTVVQKKTAENDGYPAIQIGFEELKKQKRLAKPYRNHFEKRKLNCFSNLREFRVAAPNDFEVGQVMNVQLFQIGDRIDVQGVTKGRGFQGVIKRHGKHGGPDAHGSDFHRRPGSIGMRTWPGRVLKNMGMPGRLGSDRVTTKGLTVVAIVPEQNLLLVQGSVPGAREGLVVVYKKTRDHGPKTGEKIRC